jgi:hypothetical protein
MILAGDESLASVSTRFLMTLYASENDAIDHVHEAIQSITQSQAKN